jgi:hypothetical protein
MNLVFHKKNRQGSIVAMDVETFITIAREFLTKVDNSK